MSKYWLPEKETDIKWEGKPSISTASSSLITSIGLVLFGVGGFFYEYLSLISSSGVAGLGVLVGVYGVGSVLRTEYVITKESIWKRTSLLGTETTRVKISDVQNTSYSRSFIGRVSGRGSDLFELAGGGNIEFKRITNYNTAYSLISDWSENNLQGDELPGTVQQWEAIHREIRLLRDELTRER